MTAFIVLLRAIGPITHRIMTMAEWRAAVEADGFVAAETCLAAGNMIVDGAGTTVAVNRRMDTIVSELGLGTANKAMVQKPAQLAKLLKVNPFPDAAAERPSEIAIYFFAAPFADFGCISHYDGPERIHIEDAHLIVDYSDRISQSLEAARHYREAIWCNDRAKLEHNTRVG
ncbi:MAG: DUF1697 domain-containing protein [Candidatus Devosia symbiotica]|nr:DUF1697 domain-containing protein [Candidatus Devosia symbiotica]